MKRTFIAIVCLLIGAGAVGAQVVDARVCDVLAHPKDFDGKMVRITGIVAAIHGATGIPTGTWQPDSTSS